MSYEEEDTCHMRPCTARDLQLARSEVRKSVKRDLHLGKVSKETYISEKCHKRPTSLAVGQI
jgi:hypothetical protein